MSAELLAYGSHTKEVVMGYPVTGDQHKKLSRQLGEVHRQIGQSQYPHDPELVLQALQSIIEGKFNNPCVAKEMAEDAIPTELTDFGPDKRHYDILGFLRDGEKSVVGHTMVERAVEMDANLGEDDGQYLLDNQQDIPASLRGKIVFVFTDWRHPDDSDSVCCVRWDERSRRWVRYWDWLGHDWLDRKRVLRPVVAPFLD